MGSAASSLVSCLLVLMMTTGSETSSSDCGAVCVCSYGAGLSCTVYCEALLLVYRYLGPLCPLRSGPPCHSEAAFFILGHVPGSGTYLV